VALPQARGVGSQAMKVGKERKDRFCAALVGGASPALAAQAVGISRGTAYAWKASDAAFAAQWDEACAHKIENVETQLYRMAMEKDLGAVIFFLKSHRPEIYNKRQLIGIGGDADSPPINVVNHDSDERVFFYLPKNFRDEPEVLPNESTTIEGERDADDEAAA
jgi:hypothetical protein